MNNKHTNLNSQNNIIDFYIQFENSKLNVIGQKYNSRTIKMVCPTSLLWTLKKREYNEYELVHNNASNVSIKL
jgi:hypothetical protein